MTDLDTNAVVTLGHPETEEVTLGHLEKKENHQIPIQGTETDQEIGDIVTVIIHDLTPEDKIVGTEVKGLLAETIIEDEEITEDTRLDSHQGLNHLQHMNIDLPVTPELQKNLL